eukprot:2364314-Rhodomonas_salina.3
MSLVLLQGDGERKSRARSDEEKKHHTRPKWWSSDEPVSRVPSPSRLGEWKLVWRPKAEGEAAETKKRDSKNRSKSQFWTKTTEPWTQLQKPLLENEFGLYESPASRSSSRMSYGRGRGGREEGDGDVSARRQQPKLRLPSVKTPSVRDTAIEILQVDFNDKPQTVPATSRSQMSELHSHAGEEEDRKTSRSRASSRHSRKSWSTVSGWSKPSVAESQIMTRIQALEDALKAEKMMRVRMQTILDHPEMAVKPAAVPIR